MSIYIGNSEFKEIFVGEERIRAVYLGSSILWQYDSTAPKIDFFTAFSLDLGNPTIYDRSTCRVTVLVTDTESGVATVYVNGEKASKMGINTAMWYRDIDLAADTVTPISVSAVDNAGNQSVAATRYVRYSRTVSTLSEEEK